MTLIQVDQNTILVIDTGVVYTFQDEITKLHGDAAAYDVTVEVRKTDSITYIIATDEAAEQLWHDLNELCINGDRWRDDDAPATDGVKEIPF